MWVYYQRLTDQTLYTIVNRYVEPKIAEVERAIAGIEKDMETASGRQATQLRDRWQAARAFLAELHDFRQELLRVAGLPYKPDLNDGVIINAAPLHRLFRHRQWAKDTRDCWERLERERIRMGPSWPIPFGPSVCARCAGVTVPLPLPTGWRNSMSQPHRVLVAGEGASKVD